MPPAAKDAGREYAQQKAAPCSVAGRNHPMARIAHGGGSQSGHDQHAAVALPKVRKTRPHPRPCPDAHIYAAMCAANDVERLMLRLGAEAG